MSSRWVDIDWSATWLPSEDQIRHSLQHLQFRAVPIEADPVIRLVDSFRGLLTNGGAHVAAFDVEQADDVAAWFLSRNRDEYTLADQLVHSEVFADAMPDVATPGSVGDTAFERKSSLTLDGDLALALQWGGAYSPNWPALPGNEAKELGVAFCRAVFGDRYDDVTVDYSGARWSPWFKGIAWDGTWLITDKRRRRLTAICITDTD